MSPSVPGLARTEDARSLGASVARVLADTAPLERLRDSYGSSRPAPESSWKALAELGLAGALIRADAGGLELPLAELGGVLEASGRAVYGGPLASTLAATAALDDDQLLAAIAGGCVVAVLLPGAARPEGDGVSGRWELVLDAPLADVFLVHAGDGLHAVDADQAALTATQTVDGSRTFATVMLAQAPTRPVAGEGDRGHRVATVALCADGFGSAAAAFELAVAHALTREQFGAPIGSFQAVQHLLVDAYTTLRLGGLAVRAALDDPSPRQVATALATCSDGFVGVAATAIQVLGGLGYTWESDAHLHYKRLLWLQTLAGGRGQALDELAALTIDSRA